MQPINVSDLTGNVANPRIINDKQFQSLKDSLATYGDISGVVFNRRLNHLVTGHQRVNAFKDMNWRDNIQYVETFAEPDAKGTVAYGYINADGQRYAYREVEWDTAFDAAANIAANKIQAQWDEPALAELTYQIYQQDPSLLEHTGMQQKEINKLLASTGMDIPGLEEKPKDGPEDDGKEDLSFRITNEQKQLILTAIEHIRITKDIPSQDPQSMNGSSLYYMAQQYMSTADPINVNSESLPPELPIA